MYIYRTLFSLLLLILYIIGAPNNIRSQSNLVPDGSFEKYTNCPTGHGQIELTENWYGVSAIQVQVGTVSPDYYHACGTDSYRVPDHTSGYQNARDGKAYAGIFSYGPPGQREFIQTKLIQELQQGCYYQLEFYVNCRDDSRIVGDGMGMYLSRDTFQYVFDPANPVSPQIASPRATPLSDTSSWTKVSGLYLSQGGERFITIGNFRPDSSSVIRVIGDTTFSKYGYHFIDKVSITDTLLDQTICFGDTAILSTCHKDILGWAEQSHPDQIISTGAVLEVFPQDTTTYLLYLENDTLSVTVNVVPSPIIELPADITLCKGEQVVLNVSTEGATYLWNDGSKDSTFIVTDPGTYWVEVEKCSRSRDSVMVTFKDCNVYIPNIFTPNNDDINDFFEPVSNSDNIRLRKMYIYDRWGNLIFESRNEIKWNGKSYGVEMVNGVYIYTIEYVANDKLDRKTGNVTLLK